MKSVKNERYPYEASECYQASSYYGREEEKLTTGESSIDLFEVVAVVMIIIGGLLMLGCLAICVMVQYFPNAAVSTFVLNSFLGSMDVLAVIGAAGLALMITGFRLSFE